MNKLLIAAALCLAGCAAPELVVMQSPTGELVQCRHDPWGSMRNLDVRACIDGYTAAGWHSMGGSK